SARPAHACRGFAWGGGGVGLDAGWPGHRGLVSVAVQHVNRARSLDRALTVGWRRVVQDVILAVLRADGSPRPGDLPDAARGAGYAARPWPHATRSSTGETRASRSSRAG